jgi:putative alpha-1,2-mannosidase
LNKDYFSGRTFTITTRNNSPENIYIQSAKLNDEALDQFWIPHTALVSGGDLEIVLGPQPSKWGTGVQNP